MVTKALLRERSQRMKSNRTPGEGKLLIALQAVLGKNDGLKDQVIFGLYILDFVIVSKLLVVEVDGDVHYSTGEYDERRTKFLNRCGLTVIRFSNEDVLNNTSEVLQNILSYPSIDQAKKVFHKGKIRAGLIRGIINRKDKSRIDKPNKPDWSKEIQKAKRELAVSRRMHRVSVTS